MWQSHAFWSWCVVILAVLTALTAQNTTGVSAVQTVSPDFVAEQIRMVFADVRVDAVKIGMIANAGIAEAIADALHPQRGIPLVLDPVMIAKGGAALLDIAAIGALTDRLLPLATMLTPNLPEAAALLGEDHAQDRDAMQQQGGPMRLLPASPRESLLPVELEEALEQRCAVLMEYLDANNVRTNRLVRPLHIRRRSGDLTLVAHCGLRNDRRHFKLERIVRLTRTSPAPPDPEPAQGMLF